ncbi:hypothetical protein [Bosea sp. UC22_33]|uniref:hypothetical protein n=1 Tax=Bosea sp. UC22_33 TaxID=3350165 RepID=UPI00366DF9AC
MSVKLPMLAACAALSLGGCDEIENLFANNFKKFQRCTENASRDGLITKGVAKQACAIKYSTDKGKTVNVEFGRGGFSYCPDECDTFELNFVNPTKTTILTGIHVTVQAKSGRTLSGGNTNPLFVEPGTSVTTLITLPEKFNKEEREGHSWSFSGFAGIEIDG